MWFGLVVSHWLSLVDGLFMVLVLNSFNSTLSYGVLACVGSGEQGDVCCK
jgi:hypothetical protein